MSSTTITDVNQTGLKNIKSYKSRFANQLTSKKITEEYDYFEQTKSVHDPPALPPKAEDIGRVLIVGAGMSGRLPSA